MTKSGIDGEITQIKQEALRKIVCKFSENLYEDFQSDINTFRVIYCDNFRHSYSDITTILIKLDNENPQALYNICQNLLSVLDVLPKEEYKETYKCLSKLYDHVALEQIRLRQIYSDSKELAAQSKKLIEEAEKIILKASDVAEEASRTKIEIVTVLGIFAAIVMAFTGGIAFSTSVLENMHKVSVYEIIMAILGIGFVLVNGIYVLTEFIRSVTKLANKDRTFIFVFNGILFSAFGLACVAMKYQWLS